MTHCTRDYSKKVEIQRLVAAATDAHGHIDNTINSNWQQYAIAWCKCKTLAKAATGREYFRAQQMSADITHVWWCQYTKAIAAATPDMRLIYNGDVHEILSVIDVDYENRTIEIHTRRPVK